MIVPRILPALLVALTLLSCSDEPVRSDGAAAGGHAPADVVPGSHDDWCDEHAVPESRCTRCDPSLAAAFKATGDWCSEHGLPESQCVACDPSRTIERPPAGGAK